jgi:ABC-type Fe3+-hydroxamate transport system substrate-binding protein
MKPDMVVLTDDGNPREIEQRLRKLGIHTYVFRAKRLDDLTHEIRAMGTALQIRDRAERLAERIDRVIRRYAKTSLHSLARFPRKILFVVQPDPLMVAGPGTAIDDVLKLLGLQNIVVNAQTEYPRYSLEEVIRQAPDVIFIGMSSGDMKAQSRRLLKRLSHLEAVRKGRVYYIGDPLFRMGPRITDGISEIAGYMKIRE